MKRPDVRARGGWTLLELLLAVGSVALVTVAAAGLVSVSLDAQERSDSETSLLREGLLVLEPMVADVRSTSAVLLPNSAVKTTTTLVVSACQNDDNDCYFGDPLFPRVDEDLQNDANGDGAPGIYGMDDNGDNKVDVGLLRDDDEDGLLEEDGLDTLRYVYESAKRAITVVPPSGSKRTLSTRVQNFSAAYEDADASHHARIRLSITLAGDDGATLTRTEYVYPRNANQLNGKYIR